MQILIHFCSAVYQMKSSKIPWNLFVLLLSMQPQNTVLHNSPIQAEPLMLSFEATMYLC